MNQIKDLKLKNKFFFLLFTLVRLNLDENENHLF